jgi:hypothetical protein
MTSSEICRGRAIPEGSRLVIRLCKPGRFWGDTVMADAAVTAQYALQLLSLEGSPQGVLYGFYKCCMSHRLQKSNLGTPL